MTLEDWRNRELALLLIAAISLIVTIGTIGAVTGYITEDEIVTKNVTINLTCPKSECNLSCDCEEQVCINYCPKERLPAIFVHARMVAEANDYEKGLYDCTQFTKELFRRLDNDGYKPWFCYGTLDGYRHDWIRLGRGVVIEATTGEFITPKYFKEHYKEKGCYSFIPEGF